MARSPKPGEGMTIQQYADYRKERGLPGASYVTIQKALKNGRINRNEHGFITPDDADALMEMGHSTSLLTATGRPACEEMSTEEFRERKKQAELRKLEAQAVQEELKAQEIEGTLVKADEVQSYVFSLARTIRDQILSIPVRVAPVFASMGNPNEIERYLDKELVQALEGLYEDLSGQQKDE